MDEQTQQMILVLAQVYMQLTGEQDPQKAIQAIMQCVQAAQQGDQQAAQMLQQLVQIAQGGGSPEGAAQAAPEAAQAAPQMAMHGAKLNYIRRLRGTCPNGTEMVSFKVGGKVCKKCVEKLKLGGITEKNNNKSKTFSGTNPVKAFKCGRKMKKACGGRKMC